MRKWAIPEFGDGRRALGSHGVMAVCAYFLVVVIYIPAIDFGFVNWDDPLYVINNQHIRQLNVETVKWAFTNAYAGFWMPLTWLSLAMDYHIAGLEPTIYHLHNIALHCANVVIVYLLCHRILSSVFGNQGGANKDTDRSWKWGALFCALFFGIHPLRVESVAWVTERKDVLYSFFYLAGLLAYLRYVSTNGKKRIWYGLTLVLFVSAMCSKSMAVTFPLVLLLLDIWPLRRMGTGKVLLEKIPFILLAFGIMVTALFTQKQIGTLSSLGQLPLDFRIMNAFHSIVFYLRKILIPTDLTTLYPIVFNRTFSWGYIISALVTVAITVWVLYRRKVSPALFAAWGFYVITLSPTLGFFQVGHQAAADRFTYVSSLGPTLLIGGMIIRWFGKRRIVFWAVMTIILWPMAMMTRNQIHVWKDSTVLWENTLKKIPRNSSVAYANLADAYLEAGRFAEARQGFELAIRIGPPVSTYYDGLGMLLMREGRIDQAIEAFKTAISLDQRSASPFAHLAEAYAEKGMALEALKTAREAVHIEPGYSEAHFVLGNILAARSKYHEAAGSYEVALSLEPNRYNPKYLRSLVSARIKSVE